MMNAPLRHCVVLVLMFLAASNSARAATATHRVRMYFNLGTVDIDLYANESPEHVANFLDYVNSRAYDRTHIHRTNCCNGVYTFVQGGEYYVPEPGEFLDQNSVEGTGPVPNEFDPNNGLSNTPGTLAAARTNDPDSADNGWFINATNNAPAFDPGPYTVYGQVTSGLEVIQMIPTLPKAAALQGTPFSTLPVYEGWFVYLHRVVEMSLLDGDFDQDGQVGASDLALWESGYGKLDLEGPDFNDDLRIDSWDLANWEAGYGNYNGVSTLAHFENGDANRDTVVDGLDFLQWQTQSGNTRSVAADADGDARITGLDFLQWQQNLFAPAPSAIHSIPEPSTLVLISVGVLCLRRVRSGR